MRTSEEGFDISFDVSLQPSNNSLFLVKIPEYSNLCPIDDQQGGPNLISSGQSDPRRLTASYSSKLLRGLNGMIRLK